MIDNQLIDLLACPACQGNVRQQDNEIICCSCQRHYPIKNGIPVLIVSESKI